MAASLLLALIGAATAGMAVWGLATGRIYCKGGPYHRGTEPLAFWGSVAVYLGWTALMAYFVASRTA